MDDFSKELTIGMIPAGHYHKIAEAIGPENFYKLAKAVGGTTLYIPLAESVVRPVRNRHIREEFNGFNHEELAQKYNVTVRLVQQLCGEGWIEGQCDIYSLLES